MDRENPPPPIFPTDNDDRPSDTDIMRFYAIDTLFDSAYYIGDTEKIETTDALRAPDSEQFIIAIRKEIHSLISETHTLQPLSRTASGGYNENTEHTRVWKIRTTLKCKRKKKPNGEPDKNKARAAARGDTLRRAMIKANAPLPVSYSPTVMPLTFSLFLQLAVIQQLHTATMGIKSAYLNAALPPDADWIVTTLEPHIATVSAGHVVTFTNHETIISDMGGAYTSASPASRTLENGEYPYICYSASLTFAPSTHSTTHNSTTTTFDNQPPDP